MGQTRLNMEKSANSCPMESVSWNSDFDVGEKISHESIVPDMEIDLNTCCT